MASAVVTLAGRPPAGPKILVVDDIPENLVVVKSVLAQIDAEIVCVASGHEALARLRKDKYALVLLDVMMPQANGFQVVEALRADPLTANTPVVFVTGYPRVDLGTEAYRLGAVDFLLKPIDPFILRSKVQVYLDLDRNLKEADRRRLTELQNQASQRTPLLIDFVA